MNNLYNALNNGTVEFGEEGEQIVKAPTALMLRAAKVLKTLCDTNDSNLVIINQLQQTELVYLENQEYLQEVIRSLAKQLKEQNGQQCINESVRDGTGQTSDVDSGNERPSGSDQRSETSNANSDSGSCSS